MKLVDHLTIASTSLEAGARDVERALGVSLLEGGKHPRMGTHNRLLRLGDQVYLELIAIDPVGSPPGRPRWFGLDAPATRSQLAPDRGSSTGWCAVNRRACPRSPSPPDPGSRSSAGRSAGG